MKILYEEKKQDYSIRFEVEGSLKEAEPLYKDFISQMLKEIKKGLSCETSFEKSCKEQEEQNGAYLNATGISENEFLAEKGFKTKMDIAMGLFYYYEKEKGIKDFSSADLRRYFEITKKDAPSKPWEVITENIRKSYLQRIDGEHNRVRLTTTGRSFVENFEKDKRK